MASMDSWERQRPLQREERHRHCRENPSFSSTLLDAIYRSIDEGEAGGCREDELILYRESMRKNHSSSSGGDASKGEEDMASFRRACMIEKWMEKKASEKVIVRRKSMADFDRKSRNVRDSMLLNSSSSSSDSSSGSGFSSSESESTVYGTVKSSSSCYNYTMQRPKPIRTSNSVRSGKPSTDMFDSYSHERSHEKPRQQQQGGFVKTKSKAMKIYSDLKKVKQPISPGGRLATFLNSLFTAGNAKKVKINSTSLTGYDQYNPSSDQKYTSKSGHTSTCSSASSFSRSCLSKTPSSQGKSSNGTKRSVRFYPVSVIVDEDCRPCGHKNLHEEELNPVQVTKLNSSINEEIKFHQALEEKRRVQEAAMELLKNYHQNRNDTVNFDDELDEAEDDDDEDDDAASCSSSDLFELDNLSAIGIERYREELPVYETTHLGTNRAIANGLIL